MATGAVAAVAAVVAAATDAARAGNLAPMHSIPPLHLIAAFDAVMQWRSFQKAADALSLSASTVSHRVRELEKTLGVALFTRSTRSVAPTPEGLHLHQQTKAALQALQDTFAGYAHQQRSVVRISALPSFARLRLVPALAQLQATGQAPGIEIQASTDLADVDQGDADIAIRFARARPHAHHCEKLLDDVWFPVAAPGYLRRLDVPASEPALRKGTLLTHTRQPWQPWLAQAGIRLAAAQHAMTFTDTALLIDAALAEQGIALARQSLVHDLLASGALVRLSDVALPAEQSYYLFASERTVITPRGQAVMDWIRQLARQGNAAP